tara:strand:- start:321 stop:740 length:420 start_codon:yes stop_codon:yes gene_type:complete
MLINFERIKPTQNQIDELFFLLKNREHHISHKSVPSKKDHSDFVSENPYRVWYLIYKNRSLVGSVYLHTDNSIGIDLIKYNKKLILLVIEHIKDNHKPLPSIRSLRRGDFFINVASGNKQLIEILKKLNKNEIQCSFLA